MTLKVFLDCSATFIPNPTSAIRRLREKRVYQPNFNFNFDFHLIFNLAKQESA